MTNMSIQPLWLNFFIEILLVLEFQLTKTYFGTFSYKAHFRPQISCNDSEWAGDYWLARCIEGKQTLIMSMIDDENNHFPIGSMVVKGEYLTHDNNARVKGGYVYRDYKPGASVYHFTNLIIGTNLHCTNND